MATVAGNGSTTTSGNGGPATSAGIASFYGMWVDSLGNLYLPDSTNPQVRKVNTAGIITRFIGTGTQSTAGTGGPALSVNLDGASCAYGDTAGNLYLSSNQFFIWFYNHATGQVSRFAAVTPAVSAYSGDGGPATSAMLSSPVGLFLSSVGVLYFVDTGNYVVRAIDTQTNIITTVAGTYNAIATTGDGGPATSAQMNPYGIWGNTAGVLFIADTGDSRIRKVATNGIITTIVGSGNPNYNGDNIPGTNAELNYPYNCQEDTLGNLYISDNSNNRVRMISAITGIISTIAGNGATSTVDGSIHVATAVSVTPSMIQLDSLGNIYFQDSGYVRKLLTPTAMPTVVPSAVPTIASTATPSNIHTVVPTAPPTIVPTNIPTIVPSAIPTEIPSVIPSVISTQIPSNIPSTTPSTNPTFSPTVTSSFRPSVMNVTANSASRSQTLRGLNIFYVTFFPVFFILFCIFPAVGYYLRMRNKSVNVVVSSPDDKYLE